MEENELMKREQIIRDSASFKISDITSVLAELMSRKEKNNYSSIIYNNNYWKTLKHVAFVAIDYMADEFMAYSKYTNIDYGSYAYNLISVNTFIDIYHSYKDEDDIDDEMVLFGRLLSKYNIKMSDSDRVNTNEFKNHEYINDFIDYLFELQLANGGKHLSYKELSEAMFNFLKLDESKKKKLVND